MTHSVHGGTGIFGRWGKERAEVDRKKSDIILENICHS